MSIAFKHPQILFFLCAIAIPIIIHLFSFRKYKKVHFHSIFLLKNIQQEQNKTRTKLKHVLILAARIGTIAAVVIAFAQPYIPNPSLTSLQQQTQAIAVYIDNSFSSQADSKQGMLLKTMIAKARELVDGCSAAQTFYCITNNPNQLEHIPLTKEQMHNQLSVIAASAFTKQLSEVYASAQAIQKQISIPLLLYVFSDFQSYSTDIQNIATDSLTQLNIIPFEQITTNNMYIDSCWFASPYRMRAQAEELKVRVVNNSEQVYTNLPIKLYINDSLKAIVPCNLESNKSHTISISYTVTSSGIQALRLELEDYPIVYDNTLFASYELAAKVPILLIHEQKPNNYIQTLYGNSPYFALTTQDVSRIDYANLSKYSVIILDGLQRISDGLGQSLRMLAQGGKTVICIPSESSDIESYNAFFSVFGNQKFSKLTNEKTMVRTVDYAHTIYKQVFTKTEKDAQLPHVFAHFPFTPVQHYSIIQLQNNNPFLSHIRVGKGSLFVFTSPFSSSANSFVSHPLFVGMYTMGLYVASQLPLYSYIGTPTAIMRPTTISDPVFHIQNSKMQVDFIPQVMQSAQNTMVRLHPMQGIQQSGHYSVVSDGNLIAGIAYNYSRKESQSDFYSSEQLRDMIADKQLAYMQVIPVDNNTMSQTIQEASLGIQLWRWFILFALMCVCAEVYFIRFFK